MIDIERIKKIIEEIYPLVELGGETSWLYSLRKWHSEIDQFPEEIIPEIWRCCGGQGSFTDFGLYKDGEILYDETDSLCKLRHELVKLCFEALPEIYRNKKPSQIISDS